MTQPYFSIIMPTYNRSVCITNAVNSLVSEGYKNWELIIVDDGSTDNTEEIIRKEYQEYLKNKQIQYIKSKHVGVSKARNIGIENANYDWIGYLDTDNTLCSGYFETFAQAIDKDKNAKIFYAQSQAENRIIGRPFDRKALERGNFIDLGAVVHKKILFEELGGFNENLKRLVDWDLILKYTKRNKPVFIPKIVSLYNISNNIKRITNTEDLEKNRGIIQMTHHIQQTDIKRNMFLLKLRKRFLLISTPSYKEKRAIILFKASNLFDREWYLSQYPEASNTNLEPEVHYYRTGWKLGFNPSMAFDGNRYLAENPDVKEAGRNPLEHYLISGQYEGRYYVSVNGEVPLHAMEGFQISFKTKKKLLDKIKYTLEYPIRVREEYERLKAEIKALETR